MLGKEQLCVKMDGHRNCSNNKHNIITNIVNRCDNIKKRVLQKKYTSNAEFDLLAIRHFFGLDKFEFYIEKPNKCRARFTSWVVCSALFIQYFYNFFKGTTPKLPNLSDYEL